MLGWIDGIALVALGVAALMTLGGTLRTRARLAALRRAEAPRMKLADLAAQIEHDAGAPAQARKFVALLADHAFDERFMTYVLAEFHARSHEPRPDSPLRTQVREELGPHYGAIVYQAAGAFAEIMAATKPWLLLAAIRRQQRFANGAADANTRARAVWDWFHRHPDGGPGGGAPATV